MGSEKMYKFSGVYSRGDSDLLDCFDDAAYTSIDFSETTDIPADADWNTLAANKNCIYYVDDSSENINTNVITGKTCSKLELTEEMYGGGDFYSLFDFTATTATYRCNLNGYKMLVLPFEANIPEGVNAYTIAVSTTEVNGTSITNGIIPANTPVLVRGDFRSVTFTGTGKVSSPRNLKVNDLNGVYIAMKAPFGSYYLKTVGDKTEFYRVTNGTNETIHSFGAYLTSDLATAETLPLRIDGQSAIGLIKDIPTILSEEYYTLMGQRVIREKNLLKGIYIVKSYLSDGSVSSRKVYK
jgi:glucuronoarabinoxylan endo-1,4-beta-xylanase